MKRVVIAVIALQDMSATASAAGDGKLYRCTAKSVFDLQDDGAFGPRDESVPKFLREMWTNVLVDTETGVIRRRGYTAKWKIIEKGDSSNDFIALHPDVLGPYKWAMADSIRIRNWPGEQTIRFMNSSSSSIISGTCEIVAP